MDHELCARTRFAWQCSLTAAERVLAATPLEDWERQVVACHLDTHRIYIGIGRTLECKLARLEARLLILTARMQRGLSVAAADVKRLKREMDERQRRWEDIGTSLAALQWPERVVQAVPALARWGAKEGSAP